MRILIYILSLIPAFSIGQSDTLNQLDENGNKQGHWIIYGKDQPDKGYPINGKIEEGTYINNKKNGWWTQYHKDGIVPRLKGEYANNRPFGNYIKFYPSGDTLEYGSFENGKQVNINRRFHECGNIAYNREFLDGKENGTTVYYYDNCDCLDSTSSIIEKKYEKKSGITVGVFYHYYPSGCLKSEIAYDSTGKSVSSIRYDDTCADPPYISNRFCFELRDPVEPPSYKNYPPKYDKNGYNIIYNLNDELWMDGYFKDGKLWDGKIYKYNSDGTLAYVEIWKEGKYYSDGQLK